MLQNIVVICKVNFNIYLKILTIDPKRIRDTEKNHYDMKCRSIWSSGIIRSFALLNRTIIMIHKTYLKENRPQEFSNLWSKVKFIRFLQVKKTYNISKSKASNSERDNEKIIILKYRSQWWTSILKSFGMSSWNNKRILKVVKILGKITRPWNKDHDEPALSWNHNPWQPRNSDVDVCYWTSYRKKLLFTLGGTQAYMFVVEFVKCARIWKTMVEGCSMKLLDIIIISFLKLVLYHYFTTVMHLILCMFLKCLGIGNTLLSTWMSIWSGKFRRIWIC